MRALRHQFPDIQLHFLGNTTGSARGATERVFRDLDIELHVRRLEYPASRLRRAVRRLSRAVASVRYVRSIRPHIIQASDAREVIPALLLSLISGATPVYDSHEDYFSQAYEYGGKTLVAFIKGISLLAQEFLFLRFFAAVFCTDEFLVDRYSQRRFGVRRLHLMRNLPFPEDGRDPLPGGSGAGELDLVYIGGVNQHRGITETAEHVRIFNGKFAPSKQLRYTVIGHDHPVLRPLVDAGAIRRRPWLEYPRLMEALASYDVGVCLWLPIRKFERNLPIKNFDYMAARLPILTSNFGELQRYIHLSGAGMCIDPLSYQEFEAAILRLFEPETRRRLGSSGASWVESQGGFLRESRPYVSVIGEALR